MQMLATPTGIFPQDEKTASQLAANRKNQLGTPFPGNVKKPEIQSLVVIMLGKSGMPGKIVCARNCRTVRIPHHPMKLGNHHKPRGIQRRFELPRLHAVLLRGSQEQEGVDIFWPPFRKGDRYGNKNAGD